jgi:hypothetical protein
MPWTYEDYNDYLEYYLRFIYANLNENAVFILETNETSTHRLWFDELMRGGHLAELDGRYAIPLSLDEPRGNTLGVLIRQDVTDRWDAEIRTAAQLEELLTVIQAHNTQNNVYRRPCLAVHNQYYTLQYDLFYPEYGLMSPGFIENWFYLIDLRTNAPIHQHDPRVNDAYRMAWDRLNRWEENRLLYLEHESSIIFYHFNPPPQPWDVHRYQTALVHLDEYLHQDISGYLSAFPALNVYIGADLRNYRLDILYNDLLPHIQWGSDNRVAHQQAVAGHNADLWELHRLMRWLEDRENYTALFYGYEGFDYRIDELGRFVPLNSAVDWDGMRRVLSIFRNNDFMQVPFNAPMNLEAELALLRQSRPYDIIITEEDAALLRNVPFRDVLVYNHTHPQLRDSSAHDEMTRMSRVLNEQRRNRTGDFERYFGVAVAAFNNAEIRARE